MAWIYRKSAVRMIASSTNVHMLAIYVHGCYIRVLLMNPMFISELLRANSPKTMGDPGKQL